MGWLNRDNLGISKYFQNSNSEINIEHVIGYSLESSSKIKPIEYCPIFDFNSLKPKIRFDHKQKFCKVRNSKLIEKIYLYLAFQHMGCIAIFGVNIKTQQLFILQKDRVN